MARKITIKALCSGNVGYNTPNITGELYESGGFQFCIHWNEDGTEITATEVSSGMIAARVRRGWHGSPAPRRDLLRAVDGRVTALAGAIDGFRETLTKERAALLERLNKFPAFPINEPIKSTKTQLQ